MSLQSNLKSIKASFDSDEKLLESAFTLEILWRRYRKYIIALLVCGAILGIWWLVSTYIDNAQKQAANAAYTQLIEDSTDEAALEKLKKSSPALYDMYRYFNANGDENVYQSLLDSENTFVRQLAQYEVASMQASALLDSLSKDGKNDAQNSVLVSQNIESLERTKPTVLKHFALLQEAYLLFNVNKPKEAQQKLILIPEDSMFYNEAVNLKHLHISSSQTQDSQ